MTRLFPPPWLGLAALLAAAPAWAQVDVSPLQELSPTELLTVLRGGGHILYVRHAATDHAENDRAMRSYEECAGQRNLVDKGRNDSRTLGIAVRALRIPVGRVLSSPLCRSLETAQLAFGRAEVAPETRYRTEGAERYAGLRALLVSRPGKTNTVIVGHGTPFYRLTEMRIGEGETAVVRPLGDRFEVIARIKADGWAALRAADGQ
jgi:phosphohistidine phosphatase SixA